MYIPENMTTANRNNWMKLVEDYPLGLLAFYGNSRLDISMLPSLWMRMRPHCLGTWQGAILPLKN